MNYHYANPKIESTDIFEFYESIGAYLFPLNGATKTPFAGFTWKSLASNDPAQWQAWSLEYPGCGWAIYAAKSGLLIADLDVKNVGAERALAAWRDECAKAGLSAPLAPNVTTPSGGQHVYMRLPDGFDIYTLGQPHWVQGIIDVRTHGYCVIPPSANYSLVDRTVAPCPPAFIEKFVRKLPVDAEKRAAAGDFDPRLVASVTRFLLANTGYFDDEQDWVFGILTIRDAGGEKELARETAYCDDRNRFESIWNRRDDYQGRKRTFASLIKAARENGYKGMKASEMFAGRLPEVTLPPVRGASLTSGGAAWLPSITEDAIADDLVTTYEDKIRYCEERKQYFIWDGLRWYPDKTSAVYAMTRKFVRERVIRTPSADALKFLKASFVSAIETFTRKDQRIATTADMWDGLLYILNTPAGPVDLLTGQLMPIDPKLLLSKSTSVAPNGDCPLWKKFLNEAMGGVQADVDFLQRICGCALSGEIRDHAIFFLYGPGGNGKSVFLSTVSRIFADYQQVAMQETITDKGAGHDRHPTEIAGLVGARLVTVNETEKGRRWAESKIKMLTGGDPVPARFIGGNLFYFIPQLTLMISGNHKPSLSSVGEAMRRRLHLIPFTHKPANPDPDLPQKLESEHAGILAWMIEGAAKWYQDGLGVPQRVKDATAEYMTGEDAFGQWLDERCEQAPDAWTSRGDLFASWTRWADAAREPVGTLKQFLETMRQREIEEGGRNGVRGFRRVRLRELPLPPVPSHR
jgi:P4 family phage/plasmid primase-like protien